MPTLSATDVFINTLREFLQQDRSVRASDLKRHGKAKATRALHEQSNNHTDKPQSITTQPTEATDCVSFFSSTLKGATK